MQIPVIETKEFFYELPDEKIAKFPLEKRNSSKLLIYKDHQITETVFSEIYKHIPPGYLLVFNDTKVLPARMYFQKQTGALIEVLLLEPYNPKEYHLNLNETQWCEWLCFVGNAKKWKEKDVLYKTLNINGEELYIRAIKVASQQNAFVIRFEWNQQIPFLEILNQIGNIPIPPYLKRNTEAIDIERYQTVFSKHLGSVAAPTASLHFTEDEFKQFDQIGINYTYLTLHIGAGTFKPMNSKYIHEHELHTEFFQINKDGLEKIAQFYPKIIAVGTTALRALESIYHSGNLLLNKQDNFNFIPQWCEYLNLNKNNAIFALKSLINYLSDNQVNKLELHTQIMISPGYQIKMAEGIITNFHQPQSSLLALVAAFVGDNWKQIYQYALNHNFRFLSYGDSSLLWRK
ncbi:MAG: S-adenosylmethionine:tRNA ribosyltransferase-isomerase [Bacteroidales bacterium]